MSLDTIIEVQIDRQTTVPSRAGFGIPLFMGQAHKLAGLVQSFSSMEDVDAVFDPTDEEYKAALKLFGQTFKPPTIKIGEWAALDAADVALGKILVADSDWYGLCMSSAVKADIELVAPLIEAQRKIFIARSTDDAIFTSGTTDVAYVLKAAGYDRTALICKKDAVTDYPDAAWLGEMLPQDPGSATWKFKTLKGVTVDNITEAEKAFAIRNEAGTGKNANTYSSVGGVGITEEGSMASGEFIDVIQGVDYITARIKERVYFRMVNLPKIPYTNAGVAIIIAEVNAVLQNAIAIGILRDDPAPIISAPDVQDVDPIDRGNRYLPDVKFEAQLAGAIHKTKIQGTVTV